MLLWGLAGFVDPVKRGKVFEQAIGFEGEDEFFKDNAIEVKIIKAVDCYYSTFQIPPEWRYLDVLGSYGLFLFLEQSFVNSVCVN